MNIDYECNTLVLPNTFSPTGYSPTNQEKVPPRISLIITDVMIVIFAASVVLCDFAVQNLHDAEFVLWI